MRKLASVQRILAVTPIEGADAIETAKVLGWNVVVKKGELKVGDLCIYCEIDSLMPEREEFMFLKPRGMRIRTVRLRGQVSQGICFPLSMLPSYVLDTISLAGCPPLEGWDCTEYLGITKYEPPIPANLAGEVKGMFPSWLQKTDETRVQSLQPLLDKYKGQPFYVAEKLDGSSVTYYLKEGEFGVCSRNLDLKETEGNTFWKVARQMDIENKLRMLCEEVPGSWALQGELIGEGVQNNKYRLKGQTVYFFNLFDIDAHKYFNLNELKGGLRLMDLPIVPIVDENYALDNNIENLVALSVGKSVLNKDTHREGIVLRPLEETLDHEISNGHLYGDRVSFKAINPGFLLKYEE